MVPKARLGSWTEILSVCIEIWDLGCILGVWLDVLGVTGGLLDAEGTWRLAGPGGPGRPWGTQGPTGSRLSGGPGEETPVPQPANYILQGDDRAVPQGVSPETLPQKGTPWEI